MIRIDTVRTAANTPKWRVMCTTSGRASFESESCQLAVEYALLEIAIRRWGALMQKPLGPKKRNASITDAGILDSRHQFSTIRIRIV